MTSEGGSSLAPSLIRLRFSAMEQLDPALGAIDELRPAGRHGVGSDPRPDFMIATEPVYVRGWIAHANATTAGAGVVVTIDGAFAAAANFGIERDDLAEMLGEAGSTAGFDALIPAGVLRVGVRTIGIAAVRDIGTYHPGPQRTITVVADALHVTIETPVADGIRVSIDDVAILDRPGSRGAEPVADDGETLSVRGWAADVDRRAPCAAIYAIVDGVHLFRGRYGGPRPDVADEFGEPRLVASGFDVRIDTATLSSGAHAVTVVALSADASSVSQPAGARRFSVR